MKTIYKNIGETPLEALERCRLENKITPGTPMTYAGRLDPMAEGLLIILVGEECKDKGKYLDLNKTYETEIVLGLKTDTHDLLGIPALSDADSELSQDSLNERLVGMVGKFTQKYPPYSSKTINGKPLFEITKAGKDSQVDQELWPTKDVEIYKIDLLETRKIAKGDLFDYLSQKIPLVEGDFRQALILEAWKNLLESDGAPEEFMVIKLHAEVSSGVYIRSMADRLNGVAMSIKRTKVGEFAV